ncbi:hypothetical protein [Salinibius halmophilus]|uniref:hypothetical protein n=1 Tax=Salinibius halmophilus TaxID=1853216 RepID=UPI000E661AD9|nr:hypothetical protein [Salinibius halmophilus]
MHYDPSEGTTTQAVLRNHLGNMVAVLASNETNFIDPYKISPYGLTQNGGNAKTNQLVQDKPQYDNFQIVHFGGRVYDLYSRQFLTPDPIVPNHSNISHWGRYSYGYGNPYGHVDPTGYRQLETAGYVEGGSIPTQSSGDVPEGAQTSPIRTDSDGDVGIIQSETPVGGSRPLTIGEIEIAKKIFGEDFDIDSVRIYRKKYVIFQNKDTLIAPNGNIYVHPDSVKFSEDYSSSNYIGLFVHEMTHVWQHQNGVDLRSPIRFVRSRNYDYLPLDDSKKFSDYNIEQQGDIVRDYYWMKYLKIKTPGNNTELNQYEDIIPF